jgi:hypothetical protein
LFIIFFLKANRVKSSANPSFISQNSIQYQPNVISKFPQSESHFGPLGPKGLTPKIHCGFSAKLGNFGHSWRNHFSKSLNVKTKRSNCRILKLLCWTSTSKNYNPLFYGIYQIIMFRQFIFLVISLSEVLHSKIHENEMVLGNLHNFRK